MNLYRIEMMSGRRQFVVAQSMEDAVKAVEKPRLCELVATSQYRDDVPQLTVLG